MKVPTFLLLFIFISTMSCDSLSSKKQQTKKTKTEPGSQYFDQIMNPDDVDIQVFRKSLHIAKLENKKARVFRDTDGEWTVQGPGNLGGKVNAIAVNPTNENIIYVGFGIGGLFKTTNGGDTWEGIFEDNEFTSVNSIFLDPTDPNIIFIGTGDIAESGAFFIGNGLFKSIDAGNSWTHLGLEENGTITQIIVSPENSNIIYVSTMGYAYTKNNDQGLFKTLDGGLTWAQSLFVADTAGVIDIVMDPNDSNTLFAAGWDRYYTKTQASLEGPNAKIYKTTNGGDSWTIIQDSLPQYDLCRIGLAIYPSNPAKVYAVYIGKDYQVHGVYRSDDIGENWSSLKIEGLENAVGGFGWYFGKIWVNPSDPDDVFIGGVELWRTKNNGQLWERATPEWWEYQVHGDMHAMVYTPDGKMLLGSDGGLYQSDNNGQSWMDIENIPTNLFYRTTYDAAYPNNYWGGLQDNGTTVGNKDDINNWARYYGGDGFTMQLNPYNQNSIYVATQRGNVVKRRGGDFEFLKVYFGADRTNWDTPYFLSSFDTVFSFYGTYRVYAGEDHGDLEFYVEPISEDLTDGPIEPARRHTISSLTESPIMKNFMFIGTTDGNVWYHLYNQFGQNDWHRIDDFNNDYYVSDVVGSPTDSSTLYVSHRSYLADDFSAQLWKSTDLGGSWTSIVGDLPPVSISELLVLPNKNDQVIFVANDVGVYVTLNGGEHWERVGTNMPFIPVFDLAYNVANNQLVAATYGRSLQTYDLENIILASDEPTQQATRKIDDNVKIIPNPASDIVQVSFRKIELNRTATLVVLDLTGKVILQKKMTTDRLTIDVSAWAPGAYAVLVKERHRVSKGKLLVK